MRSRLRQSFIALAFACALTAWAAEPFEFTWPQWRGPNLNGSNPTARNLPVTWSATENVAWKVAMPSWSAATPVVWGDTVFVTSAERGFDGSKAGTNDKILLLAISRKEGAIRWQRVIGSDNQTYRKQNLASPSPVTDGRYVWSMTGSGYLYCHDFSGKEIWSRDIQADFGRFGLNHGYASSPLLYGGKLYLQVLHGMTTDAPSYVLAIDKITGKNIWRVARPTDAVFESPDSYTTPTIAIVRGKPQLVILGGDYVTGHDLDRGHEIWRMGGLNPERQRFYRTISSPMAIGDIVYASSTRGKPFIAFRATGSGMLGSSDVLWKNDLGPDVPTPVTDGKRIFVVNDRGIVVAIDAPTGRIRWNRQRIEGGAYSASPLLADGKIYAINEEGTATVLSAGEDFRVLAVNRLDSRTLSSPVAVGDQLFIRTSDALYCLAKK